MISYISSLHLKNLTLTELHISSVPPCTLHLSHWESIICLAWRNIVTRVTIMCYVKRRGHYVDGWSSDHGHLPCLLLHAFGPNEACALFRQCWDNLQAAQARLSCITQISNCGICLISQILSLNIAFLNYVFRCRDWRLCRCFAVAQFLRIKHTHLRCKAISKFHNYCLSWKRDGDKN